MDSNRSDQVVEAYKQHKTKISAFHQIRNLLHDFERDDETDRMLARIGVVILAVSLIVGILYFN